jgi:hypothetical protein
MIRSQALLSIATGILWTSQASAGWVIDQVMKGQGEESKQQIAMQANQMKTLLLNSDGKPTMGFILDLNNETVTQVNYGDRSYTTAKVQEYAQMIQGAMKKATSSMDEALKDLPPDKREMVEKMMRSRMPQASAKPEDCPEAKIEMRKTGQQATIAGYSALSYEVVADGKPESELWIAKDITAWKELDPKKLEQLMTELTMAAPGCGPGQGRHSGFGKDQAWKFASEGYAVKTADRSGGSNVVEVTKAQTRVLPASEFQPPAEFASKSLSEMMEKKTRGKRTKENTRPGQENRPQP